MAFGEPSPSFLIHAFSPALYDDLCKSIHTVFEQLLMIEDRYMTTRKY